MWSWTETGAWSRPREISVSKVRALGRLDRKEGMTGEWTREIRSFGNWIIASGGSPGTRKLRVYYLERFAATTRRPPYAVTLDQVAAFLATEGWSPETRKSARASVRGFYEWAVLTGRMTASPAERLPPVRIPRQVPHPTPETILNDVMARCSDRDRLMLMLGAYAGLRRGEIARLRWDDVIDGVLIVHGKGGRTRRVPIHSRLLPALATERELRREGSFGTGYRYGSPHAPWIFPGQSGGPITPGAVGKILKRLLGMRGHTLRHRFATNTHDATGNTLAVQQLLGHAKPETTAIYVRIPDDALRAAVDAA